MIDSISVSFFSETNVLRATLLVSYLRSDKNDFVSRTIGIALKPLVDILERIIVRWKVTRARGKGRRWMILKDYELSDLEVSFDFF